MRHTPSLPLLSIVVVLGSLCCSLVGAEMYISFEGSPHGVQIPPDTQLTDQFASEGVLFQPHPVSQWSARLFEEGMYGSANFRNSPVNIVSVGGVGETTRIRFVDPLDLTQRLVRQVSVLVGDGDFWTESVRFSVYDELDSLVYSETQITEQEGHLFSYDAAEWTIAYIDLTLLGSGQSGACFDDLRYDRPIEPGSTPGDVTDVRVKRFDSTTGNLVVSYEPTCAATDHTIQYGLLREVSTYTYRGQACSIGNDGEYGEFNPGPDSYFFLVVGNDRINEGPYGTDSAGVSRPRYESAPHCPYEEGVPRCDIEP